MTVVITENIVKERDTYLGLAKAFIEDAKEDKGCHSMEICINPEKPDCVIFISKWDAKEDFLAHVGGASFEKHIPDMGPYYISGTDTILELAD